MSANMNFGEPHEFPSLDAKLLAVDDYSGRENTFSSGMPSSGMPYKHAHSDSTEQSQWVFKKKNSWERKCVGGI